MNVEIVFFDAGETLLRPYPSFPELFARVVGEAGYPVTADEARQVQDRLAPHLVELADETGIQTPSLDPQDSLRFWSHLYRSLLAEFDIEDEDLVGRLYETFSSTSSYKLFDDALPALERLKGEGYRLGLISNFERWLEEMLTEFEIGHHFEVSVISGIEGVEKPDEGIYRAAIEKAGVDPRTAVHVGDSPANDIDPAAAVGLRPVLLDRVDRYPSYSAAPRISSLLELPSLLAGDER